MADKILITGGAGFIGSNYADHLLGRGAQLTLFDNLSRTGAEKNLNWLREKHGADSFELIVGDVRDSGALQDAVGDADVIVHLAGQVAVTSSVTDPRSDFDINALGTFNLLEAVRAAGHKPFILYASTNKVYGEMSEHRLVEEKTRYRYARLPHGLPESQSLDFHSPYGCSKGTAEQYVRDYARIYGIPSVVFRQSCIYGQRQFGVEDQGWLAWFVIAAVLGKAITIYGDGKQVRDMLHVSDLIAAYDAAIAQGQQVAGQIFNMGGGPQHTLSIWAECGPLLEKQLGRKIPVEYGPVRPGDQAVYISDIRKAKQALGWQPKMGVEQGAAELVDWVEAHRALFR
ncbi:MAG: SDR family NAD(P)-dependent oxidoreductase [Anaerolineales bacterium]|nr:SDR family NAD(P)-dependent oxidoreductase [Anaerolineales bacterium]MCW5855872.1 SDR family NAD(P)-dependent oxidoreductase [Anaerolineales bacterium]